MQDVTKLDLYEFLEISQAATEKEVKSAYRKKALTCHPDKNPDNPKAAELFQQLSRALEILTDKEAKEAYDKVLKARIAAQLRNRELDSKRRKLKEELEERERQVLNRRLDEIDAAKKLEKEIERLRKEGSKQLDEERELLRKQIEKELKQKVNTTQIGTIELPRLKVKWKGSKDGSIKGYSHDELQNIFSKYGQVTALVVSAKKGNSAIVEFSTVESAESVVANEKGHAENPLSIDWVHRPIPKYSAEPAGQTTGFSFQPPPMDPYSRDYESLVLMRMRQAEERKSLTEQLLKSDEAL